MIEILSLKDILKMEKAGAIAAKILEKLGEILDVGLSTADVENEAKALMQHYGVRSSQYGHHGFPGHICTSVNEVVCHGIPHSGCVLISGDILNIDVTIEREGFHGDTSRTFALGAPTGRSDELMTACFGAMWAGIDAVKPGARVGDLGAAIREHALGTSFSIVEDYCGHGIGRRMHMSPEVPHVGRRGRGIRIRAGMAFTIEPMLNMGGPACEVLDDGWTVVSKDRKRSAQFEHTLIVKESGAEVLTLC